MDGRHRRAGSERILHHASASARAARRPRRALAAAPLVLGLLARGAGPAAAQQPVDLMLVLAIDCSYSVNAGEYDLQRKGIANALRAPEIREAVGAGPNGAIALAVIQWSSEESQVLAVPWTRIDGPGAADAAAARIANVPRQTRDGATSISAAIGFALQVLRHSPFSATRRIIDVSGDGRSNNGPPLAPYRAAAVDRGVTVNGLTILNEDPTLEGYFRQKVIAGFGAFVVVANDYAGYRDAIRRKMLREIRFVPVSRDDVADPERG